MKYVEFKEKYLPEMVKLNSFAKRIKFCDNILFSLGSGSGRKVYKFDDEFVLKLAKNVKGVAQNDNEIDVSHYRDFENVIANVVDYDEQETTWIISEFAKKITKSRFKQILGFDVHVLREYLQNRSYEHVGKRKVFRIDDDDLDKLENSDFVNDLLDLVLTYDIHYGDFGRVSSFGEINRNGKPQIVIVDYGLSYNTYNTHYNKYKSIYEKYTPDKEEHRLFELNDIKERYIKVMKNSKFVEPKKKCLIGSKEICNRGDINNWNIYETINPEEAYDHDSSISTIIDGKRDLGFVTYLSKEERLVLGDNNIGIIPIKQNDVNNIAYIIYRDKKKANRLKDIANMYGGYLKNENPDIVYEIGMLLGYDEDSVIKFINKTFKTRYIPKDSEINEEYLGKEYFNYADWLEIYINPKTIKNFDQYVRAVCDMDGNLYIVDNSSLGVTHLEILSKLHKYKPNIPYVYNYANLTNGSFLFLQRLGSSNNIVFSGTYTNNMLLKHKDKFIPLLKKCKEKNPSLNFMYKIIDEDNVFPNNNIIIENMNENNIIGLTELPFIDELKKNGGKVYSVGGAVRDEFLGKESKDLDILVTGIPFDELEKILSKYGRVDAVGKSFGILKLKIDGYDDDIDVALPRTEKPSGEGGHKGFEVKSDHNLSIKDDLFRRDFTINAIAKSVDGKIIDPYGGLKDLKNKVIRLVNPEAFSDDPLRMLRAVQFAARFGFKIEPETATFIKGHAKKINEISPERILGEFDKIVKKGDPYLGARLLDSLYLRKYIFDNVGNMISNENIWRSVTTLGEFVYLLAYMLVDSPSEFYKTQLKGDIETYKEIRALEYGFGLKSDDIKLCRTFAHNIFLKSPKVLNSKLLSHNVKVAANELLSGKYPKTTTELAVNGNDIMSLGYKGKEISEAQKTLLILIYNDLLKNEKNELMNSLEKMSKKKLNESVESFKAYRSVDKFLGNDVVFEPNGYYEKVGADGNPVYKYDMFVRSSVKETSASKTIGGSIMGLYSMYLYKGKTPSVFYVYEINEKPDVDLSHWLGDDFQLLKEVRYRKPVNGKYIGKIEMSKEITDTLENYYDVINLDPYYEDDEENIDKIEKFKNTDYQQYISNLKSKLNESTKSKYKSVIDSVINSKKIPKELKEKILKYVSSGSSYKIGGFIKGLNKPKEFINLSPKTSGVSLGADKNGFFCYTHRARSKSYKSPENIPVKSIEFIESTG